ncbi:MAG: hypothetical protein AABY22_09615, partial [Nanoarchaeota archaeon]
MPKFYKKNCNNCQEFYKGVGEFYCSKNCEILSTRNNHLCLDCGIKLKHSKTKRCIDCFSNYVRGNNNPMFGKKGKLNPNWSGGKPRCPLCKKEL